MTARHTSGNVGLVLFLASVPALSAADVARVSIEVTKKGDATIALDRVPDEGYEPAEGKPTTVFGLPAAESRDDDGFAVVTHTFGPPESARGLGEGLRVEGSLLVADTSVGKDNIGPRTALKYPRQFGTPFTVNLDVVRQGSIAKSTPSQGGRSLNANLFFAGGESRGQLFVSFQPTDTKYTTGVMTASWSAGGDGLKEIGKASIKNGTARLRLKLPQFPEEAKTSCWFVVRGDNAHIKRMRCAGYLVPSFGFDLTGTAGQVVVRRVEDGGPAAEAGLKEGDRVTSIGSERVRDVPTANGLLLSGLSSGMVELTVKRADATTKVTLTAR